MVDTLTGLCRDLKNWDFDKGAEIHKGMFSIENGVLDVDFLKDGQYYRVMYSLFNDRVWKRGTDELTDETFDGSVWAMWVPLEVLDLSDEIGRFNSKVDELGLVEKGFASESFGGYTYNLMTGAPAMMVEWKKRIDSKMGRWRKI